MRARYTVTEPLDRGGRAFRGVAESRDGHKQDVVITRVLPNLAKNETFVGLFLADLRSSLLLHHANIVEVLDIAKTPEGAYFVVTEYVDGCNLKTLVARRQRIAIQHVVHVMIECCKALAYAHALDVAGAREIVHRDLSPRAVLLSNKGEVKIADFGRAMANAQFESTDPGIVKGRFGYLSPEAASGLPVDHRGDVFAAGIVLWEVLAGRPLFLGDTDYQTVALVREARVAPIEGGDPALDTIVRKALAREASARYQGATDFADALAHHAFSRGIKLSPGATATLVRDVQGEIRRDRSVEPSDPRILARVQAEVRRMTSLDDYDPGGTPRRWN